MAEIANLKPKCPSCKKKGEVFRDYGHIIVSVPKTLGSRADKNTDKMSDDHKAFLNEKHNSYRKKEFTGALPDGAKLFKRDSEGQRISE